ncbi:unnamed protein product [Haemonchus placei]|uniref:BTB/POZ domain-containing protein n=1 Tax=Haemonchus placei TaxID=6290 RepID=A0A0N4X6D5_HAEPC|nr:unnamed protein product [Haemonchus placei]
MNSDSSTNSSGPEGEEGRSDEEQLPQGSAEGHLPRTVAKLCIVHKEIIADPKRECEDNRGLSSGSHKGI